MLDLIAQSKYMHSAKALQRTTFHGKGMDVLLRASIKRKTVTLSVAKNRERGRKAESRFVSPPRRIHVAMGDYIFHRGSGCRGFWLSGYRDGGSWYRANSVFFVPRAFLAFSCRRLNASSLNIFPT
jgi:hypothetical protein